MKIKKGYIPVLFLFVTTLAPNRIVSLKPNITELIFAIGAGDKLVGVTSWCDRPAKAKTLPKVADYIRPNIEVILGLKPDLVISSEENSAKAPIEILEGAGIETLLLPFNTLENLFDSVIKLGTATGHEEEGRALASRMRKDIEDILSMHNASKRPRTLIIVGKKPLVAAGPKTFLGEIIEIAGGRNIIESRIPYPRIDVEMIMDKDPEVIFDLSMGSETKYASDQDKFEWAALVPDYLKNRPISAVQKGRVYMLDIKEFRAGPQLAERIRKLAGLISSPH